MNRKISADIRRYPVISVSLADIKELNYSEMCESMSRGIKNVRKYGFAFKGKEVLISGVDEY